MRKTEFKSFYINTKTFSTLSSFHSQFIVCHLSDMSNIAWFQLLVYEDLLYFMSCILNSTHLGFGHC